MKSILISIKSKYVADILNGLKTIEIRKNKPKCDLPIDVYIYCTKGTQLVKYNNKYVSTDFFKGLECPPKTYNGKVVAKFTLNRVDKCQVVNGWEYDNMFVPQYCLTHRELKEYVGDRAYYEWYISNLEIFDKPRELSEFYRCQLLWSCVPFDCEKCRHSLPLTKAPQSYMFIEIGD